MKLAPKPLQWWLKLIGFKAITLPPAGMYCLPESLEDESLARHEQVHWEQYKANGAIKFYLKYLWYSLRYRYTDNPWEVQARAAETQKEIA